MQTIKPVIAQREFNEFSGNLSGKVKVGEMNCPFTVRWSHDKDQYIVDCSELEKLSSIAGLDVCFDFSELIAEQKRLKEEHDASEARRHRAEKKAEYQRKIKLYRNHPINELTKAFPEMRVESLRWFCQSWSDTIHANGNFKYKGAELYARVDYYDDTESYSVRAGQSGGSRGRPKKIKSVIRKLGDLVKEWKDRIDRRIDVDASRESRAGELSGLLGVEVKHNGGGGFMTASENAVHFRPSSNCGTFYISKIAGGSGISADQLKRIIKIVEENE